MIRINFFILACVLNSFVSFSQNPHKTYKGKYWIDGIGSGNCEYEYVELSDEQRIFDGNFYWTAEYKDSERYYYPRYVLEKYTVTGNFNDNKQTGTWKWKNVNEAQSIWEDEVIMNFNNDGILDGKFSYKWRTLNMSGTFRNGKLTSLNYSDNHKRLERATFTSSGMPTGVWTFTYINDKWKGTQSITVTFDEQGKIIKSGYRETSTGNWVNEDGNLDDVMLNVKTGLNQFILRSTKQLKKYGIRTPYRLKGIVRQY